MRVVLVCKNHILIRLADQGWLETRWAEPARQGRPARHTYRLTAEGSRAAAATIASVHKERPVLQLDVEGVG